jgi:hypothetical protein
MGGSVRLWIVLGSLAVAGSAHAAPAAAARAQLLDRYGDLPLAFERNDGQLPAAVRFSSRGPGYALSLTAEEAVLELDASRAIRARLLGARPRAAVIGEGRLAATAHHLIGRARARWHRNVPLFARVRYRDVLPGVDVVYHGNQRQLEYDFVVAPGGDPAAIRLRYRGAERAEIDAATGDLRLYIGGGVVTLRAPRLYQEIGARRVDVAGGYRLARGKGWVDVSFSVGEHDRRRALVIDPIVSYGSYLGSSRSDRASGVAVGADGSAYVIGTTGFSDFPTTPDSFQPASAHSRAGTEVFVSKLSPDGRSLVYSTFLGGTAYESGNAIAVDAAGSAYLTGYTGSADFPVVDSLQSFAGGGSDVFVSKLTADGSDLIYSTFIGGTNPSGGNAGDIGASIAVNHLGQAFVAGTTGSADFPTWNAAQPAYGGEYSDAFVLELSASGRRLLYSTFLGGSQRDGARGIAVVPGTSAVFVVGSTASDDFPSLAALRDYAGDGDAFVTRLRGGGEMVFSTPFGGRYDDVAEAVAVDPRGRPVIVGSSYSDDFPLKSSLQGYPACSGFLCLNAFVTRLASDGQAISFSTLLGGSDIDDAGAVAVDGAGDIYVAGHTYSRDFPVANPVQHCSAGRFDTSINADAFAVKLSAATSSPAVAFATCIGGGASEQATGIALDGTSGVVLAGAASGGFPTTPGSFQPLPRKWNNPDPADNVDAFVARLDQDVDAEPDVLEFTGAAFSVYEDEGIAYLRVSRTGSGFGQVSLRVLCSGGTATAGQDYDDVDAGYVLSWGNGVTGVRRHTILVTDDGPGEGTETVVCTLEAPSGYGLSLLGSQTSAILRLRERPPAVAAADTSTAIADDTAGGCQLAGRQDRGTWLAAMAAVLLVLLRRRARR